MPLDLHGENHRTYRKRLDPVFNPRRVAPLEPLVRMLCNELIDEFIPPRQVELFGQLCSVLPSRVFIRLARPARLRP